MIEIAWCHPKGSEAVNSRPAAPTRTLRSIIAEVAQKYRLSYELIVGDSRRRFIVYPRQEAMWRCYRETGASLPQIGKAFGDMDHSSVRYGIKQHEKRLNSDTPAERSGV